MVQKLYNCILGMITIKFDKLMYKKILCDHLEMMQIEIKYQYYLNCMNTLHLFQDLDY